MIESAGRGAFYVFDCLSDLAADWFSDRMLGNFFRIICPYLYELETIAYFALQKNFHSFHATDSINSTAQVIIEVFRKGNKLYIHPLKVWKRHSPTLYMLHSWDRETFTPVTSSAEIAEILALVPKPWTEFSIHRPGVWMKTFQRAQQLLLERKSDVKNDPVLKTFFTGLIKMVITRDQRFIDLVEKYFDLEDVVEIMQRMIGTGLIGGKSLGMLLARAIIKKTDSELNEILETHDSFYIGSDVFYTYLVENGCWWLRRKQKDFNVMLKNAAEARRRILQGVFPEYIKQQFGEMLEYFGQSPIIVRSSSLLEDNYGNAFSGKYESVFCANQGSPQERLETFMNAVRTVYASTMSEESLNYRKHYGLLDKDEQMALLVQRVSGELTDSVFFPHVAGVAFSFNPFVWSDNIDPESGVVRLVFGLGTRAVNRTEDDYTRLVSLNDPSRRPEARTDDARQFAQRKVDLLDLKSNKFVTKDFESVNSLLPPELISLFATKDEEFAKGLKDKTWRETFSGILTFERMLNETKFVPIMRRILKILQKAYDYPVDVEFTANFKSNAEFKINIVQCRPFQVKIKGDYSRLVLPENLNEQNIIFRSSGPIVGHSVATAIDLFIYVVPSAYSQMNMSDRYSVARIIGRIAHLHPETERKIILAIAPGRWGTSMPSLGVPVSFAEINTLSVIAELSLMHEGLVPDISLGTHFFNDIVEMDMLYLAISPGKDGHFLNEQAIFRYPNQLAKLLPSAARFSKAIYVIEQDKNVSKKLIQLYVDSMKQQAICYLDL
ncbi:MAG: PEP/pyruvate-binding domain-containing protein [Limisphaerales bacterium]